MPYFIPLCVALFCSTNLTAVSRTSTKTHEQATAIHEYTAALAAHPDLIPNPLGIPRENFVHRIELLNASIERLLVMLDMPLPGVARHLVTDFFNLLAHFITPPSSPTTNLLPPFKRHEVSHWHKKLRTFDRRREHESMYIPRNDDLSLQANFDLSMSTAYITQLFPPDAFPAGSSWERFWFRLKHSPSTQKKVIWGSVVTVLGASSLIGLRYWWKNRKTVAVAKDLLPPDMLQALENTPKPKQRRALLKSSYQLYNQGPCFHSYSSPHYSSGRGDLSSLPTKVFKQHIPHQNPTTKYNTELSHTRSR